MVKVEHNMLATYSAGFHPTDNRIHVDRPAAGGCYSSWAPSRVRVGGDGEATGSAVCNSFLSKTTGHCHGRSALDFVVL